MHLGPQQVLLNLEVEFAPGRREEIHAAIDRIEERITAKHPEVNRIFIEVESLRAVSADGCGWRKRRRRLRVVGLDGVAPAAEHAAAPDIDKRHPAPPA